MSFDTLVLEKEGHVASVYLNRPRQLNALNEQLFADLGAALDQVSINPEIRVLILAGDENVFGAGADLKMIAHHATSAVKAHYFFTRKANPVYEKLYHLELPTIAAISGLALGGVFELALACDLRIASETTTFGSPEINLGLLPGGGGTQRLPRLIGATKAKEMLFFGDSINAKEAYRLGLVNKVVAPNRLIEEAKYMAKKLAQQPPYALKMIKTAVNSGSELPLSSGLEYERRCFEMLFSTKNAEEGITAFLEKRRPRYEQE